MKYFCNLVIWLFILKIRVTFNATESVFIHEKIIFAYLPLLAKFYVPPPPRYKNIALCSDTWHASIMIFILLILIYGIALVTKYRNFCEILLKMLLPLQFLSEYYITWHTSRLPKIHNMFIDVYLFQTVLP